MLNRIKESILASLIIIIPSIVMYLKHINYAKYILIFTVLYFFIGIIFPIILIPLKLLSKSIIKTLKYISTLLSVIIIHYIVFLLIKIVSLIFKKHYLHLNIDKKCKSYYVEEDNEWKKHINEGF